MYSQISVHTPLGLLTLIADQTALHAAYFTNQASAPRLRTRYDNAIETTPDQSAILSIATEQLAAYFARDLTRFSLPLTPQGTPFQNHVWQALQTIPYGKTCSYQTLAQAIERPTASRAVAGANAANPLSIFIPCHRVIASNGSLSGYSGGAARKQTLLHLESTR